MKAVATGLLLIFSAAAALSQAGARSQQSPVHGDGSRPLANSTHRSLIGLTGPPLRRFEHRREFRNNGFFYGEWPYFPPDEESYQPEPGAPGTAAAAPSAPPAVVGQQPVLTPALYEFRENRWVRVNFGDAAPAAPSASSQVFTPTAAKELPPAVLVYRDGRTEEISSYSIIGVTLYTKADFYSTGSWTRKIQLAELDLPATIKQNHERGLPFQLPSGPNEVVLRP